jgi:hypothetical protein
MPAKLEFQQVAATGSYPEFLAAWYQYPVKFTHGRNSFTVNYKINRVQQRTSLLSIPKLHFLHKTHNKIGQNEAETDHQTPELIAHLYESVKENSVVDSEQVLRWEQFLEN